MNDRELTNKCVDARNKEPVVMYMGLRSRAGVHFVYRDSALMVGDFSWGYLGTGPSDLARWLLRDATGDPDLARQYAYDFKLEFVSNWRNSWAITDREIRAWVAQQEDDAMRMAEDAYQNACAEEAYNELMAGPTDEEAAVLAAEVDEEFDKAAYFGRLEAAR